MSVDVVLVGGSPGSYIGDHEHREFVKNNSILRLGHFLRRRGLKVLQVHHYSDFTVDEIRQLLTSHVDQNTKILGLSTSFITPHYYFRQDLYDKIMNILTVARELSPKIKLVVGGYLITKLRLQKIKDLQRWRFHELGIDYAIDGPGEIVLELLAKSRIPLFEVINGIKFIDGSKFPVADFSENANAPAPEIDGIQPGEAISLEIAHGCMFNCEFCGNIRVHDKKVTDFSRTYENLKKEIVYNYDRFGTTVYLIFDDMINDDPNKINWLTKIRNETGIPVEWTSYARLDSIKDEKQVQDMLSAGCRGLYFGIESLKADVGQKIGKITDREKIINSLYLVRQTFKNEALIMSSMIAGLPGETKGEFAESIDWMMRSEEGQYLIDRVAITPLMIYREDKGKVTANRNYPFSMYVLNEEQIRDWAYSPDWTSPWGTKAEFTDLSRSLYHDVNDRFHSTHPFLMPMFNNFGIKIADYVKSYRDRTFTHVPNNEEIIVKCKELAREYCQRMLQVTPEQVERCHSEFWSVFPITVCQADA
jgi:radical SAM superfamily enzyme YgiQ (UPF0313 family)